MYVHKSTPYKQLGKFEAGKSEADEFVFESSIIKKNYRDWSDGSKKNLDQIVSIMGEYQLGKKLTDAQVHYIKHF